MPRLPGTSSTSRTPGTTTTTREPSTADVRSSGSSVERTTVASTGRSPSSQIVYVNETEGIMYVNTYDVAYDDSATNTMFRLPANSIVHYVELIIDSVFDGTPQIEVGNAGDTDLYALFGSSLVTRMAAGDNAILYPCVAASSQTFNIIVTYTQGSATTGSGRIFVFHSVPE